MIIPNIWENKKWQPNHQPASVGLWNAGFRISSTEITIKKNHHVFAQKCDENPTLKSQFSLSKSHGKSNQITINWVNPGLKIPANRICWVNPISSHETLTKNHHQMAKSHVPFWSIPNLILMGPRNSPSFTLILHSHPSLSSFTLILHSHPSLSSFTLILHLLRSPAKTPADPLLAGVWASSWSSRAALAKLANGEWASSSSARDHRLLGWLGPWLSHGI